MITAAARAADAEVALIFPPLVNTNFGAYYPSTAVLAGHLEAAGVRTAQLDLNEDFALYLLQPEMLALMAQGEFGLERRLPVGALPTVAARLLARNRKDLFDELGRHRFREDATGPGHLLSTMAAPFRLDVPLSMLLKGDSRIRRHMGVYERYYQWVNPLSGIDAAHTVAISLPMGPQLVPTLVLAQYIKDRRPDLMVVCGGPALSLMDPLDLERLLCGWQSIDAVVQFDGELPLLALARQRRDGRWAPTDIPGVSGRLAGRIEHSPPAPGPRLDDLALPLYDPELLSRLAEPELGLVQARGCYWGHCAYCDFVELYDGSPRFRTRTPQSFVEEILHQVARYDVRRFSLVTEAIPPGFAARFSKLMCERDVDVRWNSFAMVDERFNRDLFKLMVAAGCDYLVIGLETMIDRVLRLVRKAATADSNRRFLLAAHQAGIELKINLIPNLPNTTFTESMDALRELRSLKHCIGSVAIFPFEATRSSAVGRTPEQFGLVVRMPFEGASAAGQAEYENNHLPVSDPAMTDEQREQAILAYKEFAEDVNARWKAHLFSQGLEERATGFWRFPHEQTDVIQQDGWVQCYHAGTRQTIAMPDGWTSVLSVLERWKSFTKDEFVARFAPREAGEFMFAELREYGLLLPSPSAGRRNPSTLD